MLISEDVYFEYITDEFLEHHGVLGMRWGRRRSHDYSVDPNGTDNYTPKKSNFTRNAAIAGGIVGVVAASLILKHRSNIKLNAIRIEKTKRFNEGLKILEDNKNLRMSEAVKKFGPTRPGSPEYKAALYMMDEANYKHTMGISQLQKYLESK